jgi:hypothetical protein
MGKSYARAQPTGWEAYGDVLRRLEVDDCRTVRALKAVLEDRRDRGGDE